MVPPSIVIEDDDEVIEDDVIVLVVRPSSSLPSNQIAPISLATIDRDPEVSPRSLRIVEAIKQNFETVQQNLDLLRSSVERVARTVTFDEPGEYYWTAPYGVTSVYVAVVGAGGNGVAGASSDATTPQTYSGVGGGGGGYAAGDVSVTAGATYLLRVANVSSFNDTTAGVTGVPVPYTTPAGVPENSEFIGDGGNTIRASSGYPGTVPTDIHQGRSGIGGRGLLGAILKDGGNGGGTFSRSVDAGGVLRETFSISGGGGMGGGGAASASVDGGDGGDDTFDPVTGDYTGGVGGTSGDTGVGGAGGDFGFLVGPSTGTYGGGNGHDGVDFGAGGGGSGVRIATQYTIPVGGEGKPGKVTLTWMIEQFVDGDYGDITIVDDVMTIDPGVVTEAKQVLADNTTHDVTSTKHGYAPKSPADATKFLNGAATPAYALVKDSDLSTTDITTNDATSAKHGFLPKLSNVARDVLSGTGTWLPRGTIILEDQKASGNAGGTFTAAAWQTRTLNTEVVDSNSDCTLASNQFTLVAGTYEIEASAPGAAVNQHQIRLRNITDSTTDATGTSEFSSTAQTRSHLKIRLTIAGSKAFEIQHYCQTTGVGNGFGVTGGFGTEVYTTVFIRRVA